MALPPCHVMYQFYVEGDGRLSLQMYQRSADVFLGLPFNIASCGLLLTIMSHCVGRTAGRLRIVIGDVHIYENHIDACNTQLSRSPKQLPRYSLNMEALVNHGELWTNDELKDNRKPWDFPEDGISIINYNPHPTIKAPMASG